MEEVAKFAARRQPDEQESEKDSVDMAQALHLHDSRHDQETDMAKELETERLLESEDQERSSANGLTAMFRGKASTSQSRGDRRARREERWRGDTDTESELLYKVEEGARSSSEGSVASSNEVDIQRLNEVHSKQKSKGSRIAKYALIHAVIIALFLALLYGAYRASYHRSSPEQPTTSKVLSNGTHDFLPTTILISLDGFRADFLNRGLTPALSSLVKQGVSPKYMLPSFPSLTFPNHFTLVTGMYPESHGIVGNTFWDPDMQADFYYTDPKKSMRPEFWNAEPLWETAEIQGVPAAIHMWPGSEAHIGGKKLEPAYLDEFKGNELLDVKVKRILQWLDIPGPNDEGGSADMPRPQLIAAYVPNVDSDGHQYGPNSTYIRSTIAEVDGMLGSLFQGIEERNLTDVVNVVIVSDHGMATTSNHRLVQLDDLVDRELIEHIDGWPLYGLRPKDQSQEQLMSIYQQIQQKSKEPGFEGRFEVYLRDENMPERYHFSNNARIAPIWIVPSPGWAIVTKADFDIAAKLESDEAYHPRGLHGYDHEHPLMRAIFIARGPAFPYPAGSHIEPFQNIELYNIVCDSLGLVPSPNNGSLRLPLRTTGLHDFETPGDLYDDFPDTGAHLLPPLQPGNADLSSPQPPSSQTDHHDDDDAAHIPDPLADGAPMPAETRPVVEDGGAVDTHDRTWMEWIDQKFGEAKGWASGVFGGKKADDDDDATAAAAQNRS